MPKTEPARPRVIDPNWKDRRIFLDLYGEIEAPEGTYKDYPDESKDEKAD